MNLATVSSEPFSPRETIVFPFRPWVGRAGLSIVLTAAGLTAGITALLLFHSRARYGWIGEPFVWAYVGALWLGGLKVWLGSRLPVAEVGDWIVLRPLHQMRARRVRLHEVSGTEQMIGGDRLIVYFDTPRGMRFVALNLNLVKGRREFLGLLEQRLTARGFSEKVVGRSRYLSRP
jgi:hypothetical protein